MIKSLILDFDNCCLTNEVIEFLVETGLGKFSPDERKKRLNQLFELNEQTEAGLISYGQKVNHQIKIVEISLEDITKVVKSVHQLLLPGIQKIFKILQEQEKQIILFSRGVDVLVQPIVDILKIPHSNLFSNRLIINTDQQILGIDETNPLFRLNGKVYLAESLKDTGRLPGIIAVVGNCKADLSIQKGGVADYFIYYSNFAEDEQVRNQAHFVINQFEQLLHLVCSHTRSSSPTGILPKRMQKALNEKFKVVLLENIHQTAAQIMRDARHLVQTYNFSPQPDQLKELAADCHILGIRSKTKVNSDDLLKMEQLSSIGCFCIGTDQVDLVAAANLGIPVFNAPYSNTRSVAELVLGEVVMLMRGIFEKNQAAHEGRWKKHTKHSHELRGKTIGIVGYGHIGSQVSVLFESLGLQVLFYDINDKLPLGNAKRVMKLEDLLGQSDVVTMHVPDTELTRRMISTNEFAYFKPNSLLINSSRGKIIDLDALVKALHNGQLFGAAIDVFPREPAMKDAPFSTVLQNIPNVILTPHIAGSTVEAQENIASEVGKKLIDFIATGATIGAVNFPEVELPASKNSYRILYAYRNVPGVLAKIYTVFSQREVNVKSQILKTRDNVGYMIIDIEYQNSAQISELLKRVTETIRVRRIG